MSAQPLNFSQLPPINLPFRFFISAAVFAMLAALVIFIGGETLWQSRWQPTTLALTHTFTLGFLGFVMLGALLQVLPVISGKGLYKVNITASISHLLLVVGTLSLVLSFFTALSVLKVIAIACLGSGIAVYVLALYWLFLQHKSLPASVKAIQMAIIALVVTVKIGTLMLANSLGLTIISATKIWTDIHLSWGLAGWAGLLITGVSFQVIPMFHVAPEFPNVIKRYFAYSVICLLCALSVAIYLQLQLWSSVFKWLILACFAFYNVSLWQVLQHRKRKIVDYTISYWQFANAMMLLTIVILFVPDQIFAHYISNTPAFVAGAIFVFGYLVSIVQGMLIKIIPFLCYTHLQQKCLTNFNAMALIPNMHEFMNVKYARILHYIHVINLLILMIIFVFPFIYPLLTVSLLAEFSWLLYLLLNALNVYRNTVIKIAQLP
jgi:hypothetical protein